MILTWNIKIIYLKNKFFCNPCHTFEHFCVKLQAKDWNKPFQKIIWLLITQMTLTKILNFGAFFAMVISLVRVKSLLTSSDVNGEIRHPTGSKNEKLSRVKFAQSMSGTGKWILIWLKNIRDSQICILLPVKTALHQKESDQVTRAIFCHFNVKNVAQSESPQILAALKLIQIPKLEPLGKVSRVQYMHW